MTRPDRLCPWAADAASDDTWFDQRWDTYVSTVGHKLLIDAVPSLDCPRVCDVGFGPRRFAARLVRSSHLPTLRQRPPFTSISSAGHVDDAIAPGAGSAPERDDREDHAVVRRLSTATVPAREATTIVVRTTHPSVDDPVNDST